MKKSYINGMSCISAQATSKEENSFLAAPISYDTVVFKACNADYKKYIKPAAMRRMSQSVKMGVTASYMALEDAELEIPDAIITGTGRGCRQDSETFLEKILENNEEFLTPIKFIQSTHNTVGGQIALSLSCNAYNFTYVQDAVSFESALMDAHCSVLEEDEPKNVLVGGIDELAKNSVELHQRNGHLKQAATTSNLEVLQSGTKGSLASEGASFFVLSNEKNTQTYAVLNDVEIINNTSPDEMKQHIELFLKNNKLKINTIDAVVLGNNGDVEFDCHYETLQNTLFKNTAQLYYKHLAGEYHTVSSFGMWTACKVLQLQTIPEILKLNKIEATKPIKNLLLYNQYRGRNHSLVLLSAC